MADGGRLLLQEVRGGPAARRRLHEGLRQGLALLLRCRPRPEGRPARARPPLRRSRAHHGEVHGGQARGDPARLPLSGPQRSPARDGHRAADEVVDGQLLHEAYDSPQGDRGHVVRGGGRQGGTREVNLSTKEGLMGKRLILIAGLALALGWAGSAAALEVGDKAPDFALNGTDGKPVKLSDLTAKGPIVVYTFIAAFTGT